MKDGTKAGKMENVAIANHSVEQIKKETARLEKYIEELKHTFEAENGPAK
jgi:hypothetical protein